ncbi:hypothetical protein [Pluralibacter sp.]|uniref:hypothetical protein n=1 Tax=Pluralibacter sp. TaxID=1920032 RepID=UPI002600B961|nr:hypothetical protein [Pluralibacter sp.]MBV8041061.1 hypothetical protein [Pluralibacter sp.]
MYIILYNFKIKLSRKELPFHAGMAVLVIFIAGWNISPEFLINLLDFFTSYLSFSSYIFMVDDMIKKQNVMRDGKNGCNNKPGGRYAGIAARN